MSDEDRTIVVELADRLWRAEVDRRPIDPITETRPDLTLADAYAIQACNVGRRVEAGRAIRGCRLGRTSQPRQEILGVSEPDFGMLIDDMFVEDGDEVPLESLLQPRVVVGIAFVMARDLAGPGVTTADALTAIGGVLPAIEIVDSRIADWRVQLADTVADNASAGKVVLGSRITPTTAVDLRLADRIAGGERGGCGRTRQSGPMPDLAGQQAPPAPARVARRRHRAVGTAAPPSARPAERCLRGRVRAPRDRDRGIRRGRCGRVTDPRAIADALITAERDRTPIAPFTSVNPFLDTDTGYKAQALVVEQRLQAGEHLIGAKLGFTSKVKRLALGINEPVYGRLTSSMVVPYGEPVRLDELIHPRAEPEIAFLIGKRIEPSTPPAGVLAAVDVVIPAIEVMDSRYNQSFRLPDSVADNAGAARVVLGAQGRRPDELVGLQVLGCLFRYRGGFETAAGGAVMGHPAAAVAWLANALAAHGERLEAGSIVLSGGLTTSTELRSGAVVSAEFDGLGTVQVHCC
jgi:2-keto-4-pentenoate hydratase